MEISRHVQYATTFAGTSITVHCYRVVEGPRCSGTDGDGSAELGCARDIAVSLFNASCRVYTVMTSVT